MELLKRYPFVKRFLLGIFFLISGCATLPLTESPPQKTFFFTQARELELSPCGCSTNPKGGVERQKNYFSKIKKTKDWYFAMGPAFSPDAKLYYPNLKNKYKEKAEALTAAFKDLKLQYLGLSANELIWPISQLKKWEEQSGFVWLSANIVNKNGKAPVIKRFAWLDEKEKILLTSLSQEAPKNLKQADPDMTVLSEEQSLRAILKESTPPPSLLIVLTNIPAMKLQSLEKEFSVPLLFLGATEDLELQWNQKNASNFWTGAAPRAQAILRGQISVQQEGVKGIYFEKEQSRIQRMMAQNAEDKAELEQLEKRELQKGKAQVELKDLSSDILNSRWEPEKK